jgi:WD40 repeat protein
VDGVVRVWETASGQQVAELRRPPETHCAAFRPNGRILSGHSDGNLVLWDVAARKEVAVFGGHTAPVAACLVLPDGKRALSYGQDSTVRVWDLDSSQEIQALRRQFDDLAGYRGVAFSPDGQRFLSLHGRERVLRLWEVNSGRELQRFELHFFFRQLTGGAQGVSFSPDGRHAACGGLRGLVYLFELPQ